MKKIKRLIDISTFAAMMFCASCGGGKGANSNTSGSESQTTANDSSGAESRSALGVGEDNQKKTLGYPSNQSNLNSDSTSKLHDGDTIAKKPLKDKPNKHL